MKTEHIIRILAGTLVLLSLGLAYYNPWWLVLAGFVGVNLIQSAFTGFCPAEMVILKCRGASSVKHQPPTSVSRS